MRLNVGCGNWPLSGGWKNLDQYDLPGVDVVAQVPPMPFKDGSVDEIYCGHFLEHLTPEDAHEFLVECWRCLVDGGRLGVLVPDTREILRRYIDGTASVVEFPAGILHNMADLDDVCRMFLYSTIQPSPHRWSYELTTLRRLVESHGFEFVREIDRYADPRIPAGGSAWYQTGADWVKV